MAFKLVLIKTRTLLIFVVFVKPILFKLLFVDLITQNVRDSGWSVVGKQLISPKMFNSWAVIDFVADKLDMDQIRDRVRALSSCCQQLGKFFFQMHRKPIAIFDPHTEPRHGYGNLIMTHIYPPHLLLQALRLPFPLSRPNGAIPTSRERYTVLHLSVTFSNSFFRVS
jgi:hypothetical protein